MMEIHPLGNINRKEPFGRKKDGTHYRVLVVDDSSVMRKMLVQILKSDDYEIVAEAADGAEAVEKYMSLKPDVVTMDFNMPNMDGIKALADIQKFDSQARVIMLTSEGQKEKVLEAITSGARDHVVNPPERATFLDKVKACLQP